MPNKISKALKALSAIMKNPWLLNRVLSKNQIWLDHIDKNYGKDYKLPVLDIAQLCPDFSETVNRFLYLGGGSLGIDIALLKSMCRKFENCAYFEIGTWRGESVVNVAEVAAECYTLDLTKEELISRGSRVLRSGVTKVGSLDY